MFDRVLNMPLYDEGKSNQFFRFIFRGVVGQKEEG